MSGQARARMAWGAAAIACALVALLPAGTLPAPLAVLALTTAFAIAPGAWLAGWLAAEAPADERGALTLLLAPFVHGALFTLLRLAGLDAVPAARVLALAWGVLAAERALRADARPSGAAWTLWAVAGGCGLAMALARTLSHELALRSDGSFHAGVVWAAVRALPPEDPFFAGYALRYPWGLHAWGASWLAVAPGLPAWAPLVITSTLATVATLLAVGALARVLGGSVRVSAFAQALALAGTAPFAWLTLAARAASGELRGLAELRHSLGRGADLALWSLDPGLLHPSLVLPLDKFMVVTPFTWGLAGVVIVALALRSVLASATFTGFLRLGCAVAAVGFAHPLAGVACCGATLAGVVAAGVARADRRTLAGAVLAALAGLAILGPYLWQVSAGGSAVATHANPSFAPRGAFSAVYAGALLLLPAWLALRVRGQAAPLQGMLLALTLPACALGVPGENQSKLLNLAFVLAAAPAACAWARAFERPARRTALALLFAASQTPTLAAMLCAYALESPASLDAPSRPPEPIVAAVRDATPRDAVLVDATQDTTRGCAPALPGETGRTLLSSGAFMASKWGYPEAAVQQRRAAAEALARGQWPPADGGRWLRARNPDLWLILPDDTTRAATFEEHIAARALGVRLVRIPGLP